MQNRAGEAATSEAEAEPSGLATAGRAVLPRRASRLGVATRRPHRLTATRRHYRLRQEPSGQGSLDGRYERCGRDPELTHMPHLFGRLYDRTANVTFCG